MPELLEYQPDAMIELSNDERKARSSWIKAGWQYYDGNMRKPLKVKQGQPDDNVLVNLVAKMVDQSVELLFGDMPEFQIDDSDETSPEEEALAMLWTANRGPLLLNNLATNGALGGQCYVKLLPTEDQARPVRFVALKPEQVTVFWRPDDLEQITAYMIYWSRGDNEYREDHVNMGSSWQVVNMTRKGARGWTITNDAIWPFPWSQVVDWQNLPDPREYYGMPDLQNAALNDALNFVLSNTQRIIRYHAHPRTVGTGFNAANLTAAADVEALWTIPNPEAKVTNLEMQSDLASSMAFSQAMQAQFWSEHRGFDMTSIKDRLGQLTNFGLRVLMGDALNKTGTKRELYGMGLEQINQRALELMGYGPDNITRIVWPDMLPANTIEAAQVQQLLLGMGVTSKSRAALALGLDWEQEQQRMEDETTGDDNIGSRLLAAFERGQ